MNIVRVFDSNVTKTPDQTLPDIRRSRSHVLPGSGRKSTRRRLFAVAGACSRATASR